MLSFLHIENIAVIERADIAFSGGFHVLTGETGAGKSIVVDSISTILGERTGRDLIRTGCEKACVSAVFHGIPTLSWFTENGVDYDGGELSVQRELYADGKNICRVNGRPLTVSALRSLGVHLIHIFGQHDSRLLFDEATHLGELDAFCNSNIILRGYRASFIKRRHLMEEIETLTMDEGEKLRQIEMLKYQIAEIEQAGLKPGEDEELECRRRRLQNAEKLSENLYTATVALYGDEETTGASGLLSDAARAVSHITQYDESFIDLAEKLTELKFAAEDAAEQLRDVSRGLEGSNDELDRVEARVDVIYRLRRKYGATVAEILSFLTQAKAKLEDIELSDERIQALKQAYAAADAETRSAGLRLREARAAAAKTLEARVLDELSQLDMGGVQFVCAFEEKEPSDDGMDTMRFLLSANAGEALKPLSRVASGGELARIMLAIQNVMSARDPVNTQIFDEVDSGVSGHAAQMVGEKLLSVSHGRQVLCVTHLPQIAALADVHLLVRKSQRDGRTYTSVDTLDREGRIEEISRIIGGARITDATRKSASDMLRV